MLSRHSIAAAGLLALSSLLPAVTAIPEPNTVQFKYEKRKVNAADDPSVALMRRANTVTSPIANEVLLYFINVTVGTPGQPFSLQLDTGSSDIWFPTVDSDICTSRKIACTYGSYDYSASKTFRQYTNLPEFQIQYVDGSQISGAYISDVLNIGGVSLTNMTMAAATTASRGIGIMGIGFQAGESSNFGDSGSFTYPNVINVLKDEGHINTLSYSLWLDDYNSQTGSILFGGIDTDKYMGSLVALPIQTDTQSGTLSSFTVAWTGLTITGEGQTVDLSPSSAQPAILDSGTTQTYVPDDVAENIFNAFGVTTDPDYGNVVPCKLGSNNINLTFEFGGAGGAKVAVPLSEFVQELLTTDGSTPKFRNGDTACTFAIDGAGTDPILFGDSFLRSAYVVYDLENLQIGLAQTNFNGSPKDGNVQAINSNGIPDVVSTADAVTVAQTFTGRPLITADQTATGTAIGQATGVVTRSTSLHLTATAVSGSGNNGGSSGGSSGNAANSNMKPLFSAAAVVVSALALGFAMILM